MPAEITTVLGEKSRCSSTHNFLKTTVVTDISDKVGGYNEQFSPSDLVAAAYCSCLASTMWLYAQKHGLKLEGTKLTVQKINDKATGAIAALPMTIDFSIALDERHKKALQESYKACVVHKSLNPAVETPITYNFK